MSMDPTHLFLSLITGGIGFILVVYGKKEQRWPQLAAGVGFLIYPYFTSSVSALVGMGFALGAGLWLALRQGW
jgi:hypothetical protein